MKIILIHGEDAITSRNYYLSLVEKAKSEGFTVRDISSETNLDLGEKLSGQSLFEEKILFIHEKLKNLTVKDLKWIKEKSGKYNGDLLLWYDGNTPVKVVNSFPKGINIKKFDLPKIIFNFLDSFYPGNCKNSLALLSKLLESQPVELVFAMLTRHIRDLYWVSKENKDLPSYQSWRIAKLKKQASYFTPNKLKRIINFASEADVKTKTSDGTLKEFLDLIMVTQLQ
ncbi:MAG TPA: hypothetical protein VF185_04030 [Patescibacteria group bacterium]